MASVDPALHAAGTSVASASAAPMDERLAAGTSVASASAAPIDERLAAGTSVASASATPIDDESGALAAEFLLRDPSTDHAAACSFLDILPAPNNDHLRPAVLLQALRHELSRPSLSDRVLSLIHSLLSIPRCRRPLALRSASAAFVAVGVEAASKHLRRDPPDVGEFKLAVQRVWKMRVRRLAPDPELSRWLVSDEFAASKRELVSAMGNDAVRRGLVGRDTKAVAVQAVGDFLEAVERELGPPLLVLVSQSMAEGFLWPGNRDDSILDAAILDDDDTVPMSSTDVDKVSEIPPSGEVNAIGQDMNLAADEADASLAKKNPIAQGSPKDWKKFSQYDPLPHDEVKRTLKELRISSKDLKSVVDDPLPSVLDLFNNVMKPHVPGETSKTCSEGINHLSDKQGQIPSLDSGVSTVKRPPTIARGNENCQNAGLATLFDKPKQTAQTYQWSDDSISSNSQGREIRLPSLRKRLVSPLKVDGDKRRRRVKRWNVIEEDTLRTAVEEYGRGNWKVILNKYRDIFEDRTEIDLKDKWRNMARFS